VSKLTPSPPVGVKHTGTASGKRAKEGATLTYILQIVSDLVVHRDYDPKTIMRLIAIGTARLHSVLIQFYPLGVNDGTCFTQTHQEWREYPRGASSQNATIRGKIGGTESGLNRHLKSENFVAALAVIKCLACNKCQIKSVYSSPGKPGGVRKCRVQLTCACGGKKGGKKAMLAFPAVLFEAEDRDTAMAHYQWDAQDGQAAYQLESLDGVDLNSIPYRGYRPNESGTALGLRLKGMGVVLPMKHAGDPRRQSRPQLSVPQLRLKLEELYEAKKENQPQIENFFTRGGAQQGGGGQQAMPLCLAKARASSPQPAKASASPPQGDPTANGGASKSTYVHI